MCAKPDCCAPSTLGAIAATQRADRARGRHADEALEAALDPTIIDIEGKRARFRALHEQGCFVIPNPWDVGSAKHPERLGFEALATTSAGAAWARGREDGQLSCQEVLAHLREICAATPLPVNADFEAGYAVDVKRLAKNVAAAVDTGIAGLSIEDFSNGVRYDVGEAVERVMEAKQAIRSTGADVLLIARAEGFIRGNPDLDDTIARLQAYSRAGADCLYAPGVNELSATDQIVKAVAPTPLNVLMLGPAFTVSDAVDVQSARAAKLLTVPLALFGFFVWAPRVFFNARQPVAWGGFAITMLVCGAAWMVADGLHRRRLAGHGTVPQ
ncbi:MAG TPA: isocitrate lyase/phosphoenolpyruvate mutase family protein [Vicinamibacterales bacterium]|nr:isocitrate lyase/phosphoenolpyruvate mutase family protein [Vicinamibacterales bacterium]